jgi:hypothetical protein
MSLLTVKNKIVDKLNSMSSIKAAFNWETSNKDGKFPYATVTLREGEGEFVSSSHNSRTRGFTIKVYQEQSKTGQGPENAERIITQFIDELETAFDMDTTLSGTVKYVYPFSWRAGYEDREFDTRILEIDLDAYEIVATQ